MEAEAELSPEEQQKREWEMEQQVGTCTSGGNQNKNWLLLTCKMF